MLSTVSNPPTPFPPPDTLRVAGDATVVRTVTVRPGMCGANAQLLGQVGDWTWDSVGLLCGLNPFRARTPEGEPSYLSFFYFDVRGDRRFHLQSPTFGDRLQVVSRCFDYGPRSVLTVHRIAPLEQASPESMPADEAFLGRRPGSLYVQNFNRWIRREGKTNDELGLTSPVGFDHAALPTLPDRFSPRRGYDGARRAGAFPLESGPSGPEVSVDGSWHVERIADPARDINGVGLMYFASYLALIDSALAEVWRDLGRDDRSFLDRCVVRNQVCLLGNVESGTRLRQHIRRRPLGDRERFDVEMVTAAGERRIALAALDIATDTGPPPGRSAEQEVPR